MQRDSPALLWDAHEAISLVREFTQGKSFEDYLREPMLRSAVERQLGILGEALNRLSRVDPETAARLPELPRIVAFRNILVHGYAEIDNASVWRVVENQLDPLDRVLQEMPE